MGVHFETDKEGGEMTLRDYLLVLFRHQSEFVTTVISVMVIVLFGLQFKTPLYRAEVKMLAGKEAASPSPYAGIMAGLRSTGTALTQSEIVKSNSVVERAVIALGLAARPVDYERQFCSPFKVYWLSLNRKLLDIKISKMSPEEKESYLLRKAVEDLKERITVKPIRDTELFTITVTDFDQKKVADIANVLSRSYIMFDLGQQLTELKLRYGDKHPDVKRLKDSLAVVEASLNGQLAANEDINGLASVKIVEEAQAPLEPLKARKLITLVLAFFLSIFLGVMLAFGFEYLDTTFKSAEEIEALLNIPSLGFVPQKKERHLTPLKEDNGLGIDSVARAYDKLVDRIHILIKDRGLKALLFTAVLPGEGVTTVISHLSTYFARKERDTVLLIDANLRNPLIHKLFGLSNDIGLAQVIEEKVSFNDAVHDTGGNLHILTSGTTSLNPLMLLDSAGMAELIAKAKGYYAAIFIDIANMSNFKDAMVLSAYVDGSVLIVREGKTKKQIVQATLAPFNGTKANLIGTILNNRTFAIPKFLYKRL